MLLFYWIFTLKGCPALLFILLLYGMLLIVYTLYFALYFTLLEFIVCGLGHLVYKGRGRI